MENVILIQQTDELTGRHCQAGVGITGNTFVFLQLFIDNSSIGSGRILFTDFPHIAMGIIRTVRQAKLPVLVGLVHHRIQHFDLEFFFVIPEGHQNTDLRHSGEYRLPFFLSPCFIGEAFGSELLHCFFFVLFVSNFVEHAFYTPTIFDTILLADAEMHGLPQRRRSFPKLIVFNAIQFELQIILLSFQIRNSSCQICIF